MCCQAVDSILNGLEYLPPTCFLEKSGFNQTIQRSISDFSGTEGGSGVDGKQVRGISGSEANLLKLDFGDGCIILKQLKNHELYTYNR